MNWNPSRLVTIITTLEPSAKPTNPDTCSNIPAVTGRWNDMLENMPAHRQTSLNLTGTAQGGNEPRYFIIQFRLPTIKFDCISSTNIFRHIIPPPTLIHRRRFWTTSLARLLSSWSLHGILGSTRRLFELLHFPSRRLSPAKVTSRVTYLPIYVFNYISWRFWDPESTETC